MDVSENIDVIIIIIIITVAMTVVVVVVVVVVPVIISYNNACYFYFNRPKSGTSWHLSSVLLYLRYVSC